MEGPTGIVVMFLILIGLSLVGKLVSVVSNFLTNLEKQARERMKQVEAERRAMAQGGGGGPPRDPRQQQPQASELEQLFQMLTGQAPAQRPPRPQPTRPQRGQPPGPPPPMPRRPTRRVERAPELEGDEGGSIEGDHGGHLTDRHLHSRVEDAHAGRAIEVHHLDAQPRRGSRADRQIAATLSSATPDADESERDHRGSAQTHIVETIETLPPLARGVLWSEILGPARWKTGPLHKRSARRV